MPLRPRRAGRTGHRRAREGECKAGAGLNKIDLVRRETLLETVKAFNARWPFAATFLISALTGDGVADLKAHLAARMPPSPWLYPEDQIADVPLRLLAAEITREKIFLRLHEELPYASTVETESWKERKDGSVRVDQVIYVERESQRKIVLGKGGQTIKAIGQAARVEIAELVGQPVHLFVFVKVRSAWASDPERLRIMGRPGTALPETKQYCLPMRGRPRGALPGVAAGMTLGRVGEPLGVGQFLQRRQPVLVVALSPVLGPRRGDLAGKRLGPFAPGKRARFGKPDDQREGLRLPRLMERRPVEVGRDAGQVRPAQDRAPTGRHARHRRHCGPRPTVRAP
jgi:hypothetical protein